MAELEVNGMEELMKKLEEMGSGAEKVEDTALKAAGKILVDETRKEVPVDTGNLKESIKISDIKLNGDGKFVWVGDVDRKAEYGWCVEFGTSKKNANPFMSRSFEKTKGDIKEAIADEIRKGLGL